MDATSYIDGLQRLLFPALYLAAGILGFLTFRWAVHRTREANRATKILQEIQDEFYEELARLTSEYEEHADKDDDYEYHRALVRVAFVKDLYTHIINDVSSRYAGEKQKGPVRLK